MKKKTRRVLVYAVAGFFMWRVSLCLGMVRAIPKEWVDYRNHYTRDSDPSVKPNGDVRCPLCYRHVLALYGGIAEDHNRNGIYTRTGKPVWRWEGCILDACWECDGCGMRFNPEGKAIIHLPTSDDDDEIR